MFSLTKNKKKCKKWTKFNGTQRKLHKVGTYEIYKISLSCFDDKRYILNDGICYIFIKI